MGTSSNLEASGRDRRIALVISRFNEEVTEELAAGARKALVEAEVDEADIIECRVPGAFELAPTCRQVLSTRDDVDAIIALGAVIRGETPHFTFISEAAARALQSLATELNVPLIFGVLTTDTHEQAANRADRQRDDKGGEAARAALSQIRLYEELRERDSAVHGFQLK